MLGAYYKKRIIIKSLVLRVKILFSNLGFVF